ncbi:MAG: c-type cytochrome [Oscillochloris sp.]|nr:c-type cytochrome [Oscillochloris sp.]
MAVIRNTQRSTSLIRWLSRLALLLLGAWALAAAAGPLPLAVARLALGRRLLAERRLSLHNNLACLDCHQPALGYSDGRAVATADGLNTPTFYGLASRTSFGWFSPEVPSLEAFILRPLANPREMGPLSESTLSQLRGDPALYAAYAAAFPHQPVLVTWEQTAQALALALRAMPTPPPAPLTPTVQRGQALFAELGCAACHRGPTLSSEAYFNTGVSADQPRNRGLARVPSLLGLAQTAPYFHDGSAATLADVVRAYERGGMAHGPALSPAISPFVISAAERADLVAFLASR